MHMEDLKPVPYILTALQCIVAKDLRREHCSKEDQEGSSTGTYHPAWRWWEGECLAHSWSWTSFHEPPEETYSAFKHINMWHYQFYLSEEVLNNTLPGSAQWMPSAAETPPKKIKIQHLAFGWKCEMSWGLLTWQTLQVLFSLFWISALGGRTARKSTAGASISWG